MLERPWPVKRISLTISLTICLWIQRQGQNYAASHQAFVSEEGERVTYFNLQLFCGWNTSLAPVIRCRRARAGGRHSGRIMSDTFSTQWAEQAVSGIHTHQQSMRLSPWNIRPGPAFAELIDCEMSAPLSLMFACEEPISAFSRQALQTLNARYRSLNAWSCHRKDILTCTGVQLRVQQYNNTRSRKHTDKRMNVKWRYRRGRESWCLFCVLFSLLAFVLTISLNFSSPTSQSNNSSCDDHLRTVLVTRATYGYMNFNYCAEKQPNLFLSISVPTYHWIL